MPETLVGDKNLLKQVLVTLFVANHGSLRFKSTYDQRENMLHFKMTSKLSYDNHAEFQIKALATQFTKQLLKDAPGHRFDLFVSTKPGLLIGDSGSHMGMAKTKQRTG